MRTFLVVLPALALAGCAGTRPDAPPDPRTAQVKVAPVEYRSAFDGYRKFAEQEPADWRRANDEVGAAGGHGAHK